MLSLCRLRATGHGSATSQQIQEAESKLRAAESRKRRLITEADRMKKRRIEQKKIVHDLAKQSQENAEALKHFNRGNVGRPSVDLDQSGLCTAILELVGATSAADARRRSEGLRSVTTVDELADKLEELNYNVSRSAAYLRLLPRRADFREGKRHINTVPVKLLRPEHSLRKAHEDRMFAKAGIDYIIVLCEIFGPAAVNVLCTDDKACIPLGLAAAQLQSPILVGIDYRLRLSDHDFVVGQGHKLIPSVYAKCNIKDNGVMSYSGPTFIFIRSAKHHGDVNVVLKDEFFNVQGKVKPILFQISDGATDEGPRFPKVLQCAVACFKETGVDVLVHAINAPGLSAFNPCERRMAPLSHKLVGLVLKHEHYGKHLDSSGKTVNLELEKKNFEKAADTLANIWEESLIDGHKVEAHSVKPGTEWKDVEGLDPIWVAKHVRQSKYVLQIVKCTDPACCKPFRSSWLKVFPQRFLPCPAISKFTSSCREPIRPSEMGQKQEFMVLHQRMCIDEEKLVVPQECSEPPFDLFCPSIQSSLKDCICPTCGIQWPNKTAVSNTKRSIQSPRLFQKKVKRTPTQLLSMLQMMSQCQL